MKTWKQSLAVLEMLLVLPGVLFMTALFVRNLSPTKFEPARSALRLVNWFADNPFLGLDIFLIALPLTAFFVGAIAVLRTWRRDAELRVAAAQMFAMVRAHLPALLIAGATLAAGFLLALVALHMVTD